MKHKLTRKLMLYFSIALVAFSLVIGLVFLALFRDHTFTIYQADLEKRAKIIATGLANYLTDSDSTAASPYSGQGPRSNTQGGSGIYGNVAGYGGFLRFIDDIAMTDVWIVDRNLQVLMIGQSDTPDYQDGHFSQDAVELVQRVFAGQTDTNRSFSQQLKTPTLTVGTPIIVNDQVIGALLLHTPVEGMDNAVASGLRILLISGLTALALSILLALLLAVRFTRPLEKMRAAALQLAEGNYDVTTDVRQDDEIGALASAIDHLSGRLAAVAQEREQLDQLRQDFVVNVSHELRTPVTVLRSSLEALTDRVVTEPAQVDDYHRQMLQESQSLERLVNDLLELSKLQNADFVIQQEVISVCDVLSDALRSISPLARSKNLTLDRRLTDVDCRINGDYGRIRQMLLVILDNAVKFSPPDGTIEVSLNDKTIQITDQGPGIPAADLPHIFDKFYKTRTTGNQTGSGLGLAIAREIARRHGINIEVHSILGQGSTFRFSLPG